MSSTYKMTPAETRYNVMRVLYAKYGNVGFGPDYTIDVENNFIALGVEPPQQMGSVEHCSVSFFRRRVLQPPSNLTTRR